jgi:hypothetical protein
MNKKEKILLELYFPHFISPTSSRFEEFFSNLEDRYDYLNSIFTYNIYPERIISGEDKRTSIVIKNIPRYIKKREIRAMIEAFANINYLGIIKDKTMKKFIIAYLNVINYRSIVPIFMGLRKHIINGKYQSKMLELYYSEYQGKENLKKFVHE